MVYNSQRYDLSNIISLIIIHIIFYITYLKGCGGTLNSGKGHILSPNYPLPVQEALKCYYKISVE